MFRNFRIRNKQIREIFYKLIGIKLDEDEESGKNVFESFNHYLLFSILLSGV